MSIYEDPGPIPNRWLYCPRKAEKLIVDVFMAFKTPLSRKFDEQIPPECRFPPKMLFDICKTKKIKFGLWIDLTNTNRFYNKNDVELNDCKYVKLQCRGHGETPSKEQTSKFIDIVHNFVIKNPLQKIAVHCTHGFNRTGFLIVSYMVEKMDMSLEKALQIFSDARPVGIYKDYYLAELYKRYGDVEDTPSPPPLPDWCLETDDTNSNTASKNDFEMASTSASSDKKNKSSKKAFMKNVPGVTNFEEQPKASHLQRKVRSMCEWNSKGFPGSQPVSMDTKNITSLAEKPYHVSWKADGTRYMMLIDGEDEVYFFDRDHSVFKVKGLRFVHRKDLRRHITNTLLDGEMVIDLVDGKAVPRYLAYDIIVFEGEKVGKMPFYPDRMMCLEKDVIQPRYMAMQEGLINKSLEPFSVRKKDFWPCNKAESLLGEKFIRLLSHEPDGLIFQPSKDPYVPGSCYAVLKWKPLEMNSIDFRLKVTKEGGPGKIPEKIGVLYVGNPPVQFAKMKYSKAIKDLDNRIIECKYENHEWKFMRERTDKSFPNSYDTAAAVMESIKHPVTKDCLLNFIRNSAYKDESDIMPPPQKKIRR